MKKDEVKIGGLYSAEVSDRIVTVRIDGTHTSGGWNATNTATGKHIRIKSAQRLRAEAGKKAGTGKTAESAPAAAPVTKAAKVKAGKAATKKGGGDKKTKDLSALDAATLVLRKAGAPMRCGDLITAMAEQKLWTSPGGKTPEATLSAAMLREIRVKQGQSRFKKVDRGQFRSTGKGA